MHDDQIDIDDVRAQNLIGEQFPQYVGQPVTRVRPGGTVNAIFRIGDMATARFPLRANDSSGALETLRREADAMAEFHAVCPFPAPKPLGLGRPDRHYPLYWSMQSWVEGASATPTELETSDIFAKDLGALLKALRSTPTNGRTFDGVGRGGDLADHDQWMATCFDKSQNLLDIPRLSALWQHFRALPKSAPDVMSHKDLIPFNLLVRQEHLTGVLDTGSFGAADPALDLVAGWHMLDAQRRATLRVQLGCDDLEWQRGAAWAFQQAMGLVWYYEKSNPPMHQLGRKTLERILDAFGG